ncbi:MAG: SDR family NAD(P)-dependent oxidoreductase [Candidatus Omnitrophica bacterium]|nr:SDR family NAD(P)-dependent oxidoreductase [Candidatus Omnitrophota bacterium]
MSLQKMVLITGCSSGFGRETARYLKARGWRVFVTARKENDIQNLLQEGFEPIPLNLASSASIRCAVETLLRATKDKLDAVVNNAGYTQIGAIEDIPREVLREQFETNFFGPIELTSMLLPVFRRQGYGRIIFIANSDNNGFAFPFLGAESASKNALVTVCNALRRELKGTNINISYICPGGFHTRLMEKALARFRESITIEKSYYKSKYEKLVAFLAKTDCAAHSDNLISIAQTVYKLLESKKPRIRVVLPFSTKLHFWAHRFLTERMLDTLLFLKMKFVYKML